MSNGSTSRHPWFDELYVLESEMLDPKVRGDRQRLQELLRDDFGEFGSSGRVYGRSTLIDMLLKEEHATVTIKEFSVRQLDVATALVTYRSVGQAGREARRSSIWVRDTGHWQMAFHQGTRISSRGPVG